MRGVNEIIVVGWSIFIVIEICYVVITVVQVHLIGVITFSDIKNLVCPSSGLGQNIIYNNIYNLLITNIMTYQKKASTGLSGCFFITEDTGGHIVSLIINFGCNVGICGLICRFCACAISSCRIRNCGIYNRRFRRSNCGIPNGSCGVPEWRYKRNCGVPEWRYSRNCGIPNRFSRNCGILSSICGIPSRSHSIDCRSFSRSCGILACYGGNGNS